MRTIKCAAIVFLVAIMANLCLANGTYSGGNGTEEAPFLISNTDDWMELINNTDDWDKFIELTANIDFENAEITPVGNLSLQFTGVLNGAGHTISNARITLPEDAWVGLIGYLGSDGAVYDLGVEQIEVSGRRFVGGLAGDNRGTITRCYNTGSINGTESNIGGLVGSNDGTVTHSYNTGSVNGDSRVGGLVGNNSGIVTNSYSSGTISGENRVGGLVGNNHNAEIGNSYSAATVNGTGSSIGGLLGYNRGTVNNCYAIGAVSGGTAVGGLVGDEFGFGTSVTRNSYWNTETTGQNSSTGGEARTTVEMTYPHATDTYVGWDFDALWAADVNGDVNDGYPFLDPRQPTPGTYSGGTGTEEDPFQISNTDDWMELLTKPGDWDKHFVLTADIDFENMSLSGIGDPSTPFTGSLNGAGFVLHNAVIAQPDIDYIGLISCLGAEGKIHHLGIENFDVSGDQIVGGLLGLNEGSVNNCYTTGTVSGNQLVGGLVGQNKGSVHNCHTTSTVNGARAYVGGLIGWNERIVNNSHSTGTVTGTSNVGGLVGRDEVGLMNNCYATGSVSGDRDVGGLVGMTDSSLVNNCYAIGAVSGDRDVGGLVGNEYGLWTTSTLVVNSYWDTETTGQDSSEGGVAKNTDEMIYPHPAETYVSWDFDTLWADDTTGEVNNGYPYINPRTAAPGIYSGGSGTEQDPFLISNTDDWLELTTKTGDWNKHFLLTADLDFMGAEIGSIATGSWWFEEDLFLGTPFTGNIDGAGFIIKHAALNGFQNVAPIGFLGLGGQIHDLGVEDLEITGEQGVGGLLGASVGMVSNCYSAATVNGINEVGGLIGANGSAGSVRGCYATGTVNGAQDVGGLIGANGGTLNSCYASGAVTGEYFVGGLVGWNHGNLQDSYATGTVNGTEEVGGLIGTNAGATESCYATGAVTGEYYVGGLMGWNDYTVTNSYATGTVNGSHELIGGLMGGNAGALERCYATGTVNGNLYVGGLTGDNYGPITNCYVTGAITGEDFVGGLVGWNEDTVDNCYAIGKVLGSRDVVGGLIAFNLGTAENSYWNTETTEQDISDGGDARTTAEMTYPYAANTYVGWDFDGVWSADTAGNINNGYPYLGQDEQDALTPSGLNMLIRKMLQGQSGFEHLFMQSLRWHE